MLALGGHKFETASSPLRGRAIPFAVLGSYASGVYKPNWSKSGPKKQEFKTKWRRQKLYMIRYRPYRVPNHTEPIYTYKPYRTKYGEASRLARDSTCQEPCDGAKNYTRYEDRTVRRTVPNMQIPTSRTVQDAEKRLRTRPP